MAHSKTFTKRCASQNCVFFEELRLFMSLWDVASVETGGLGRGPSLGGLEGRSPQPKQIIIDFKYFKTVSFTTSDVY